MIFEKSDKILNNIEIFPNVRKTIIFGNEIFPTAENGGEILYTYNQIFPCLPACFEILQISHTYKNIP